MAIFRRMGAAAASKIGKDSRMNQLGTTVFLALSLFACSRLGAQKSLSLPLPTKAKQTNVSCTLESLPPNLQRSLEEQLTAWKIQEPTELSPPARERWEAEKPLACPGIAVGHFEPGNASAYGFLLVPKNRAETGYKVLVLSPKAGETSYKVRILEQSTSSSAHNLFIHRVPIEKFFDEPSRRKFKVEAREGILVADAGEKEYQTDLYFWSDGTYKHQPIDY